MPLGLAALGLALAALPGMPALPATTAATRHGRRFDAVAAGLTAVAFAALIGALGAAAQREALPLVLWPLALCVLSGGLLLRRQAGHPAPMLPVDLLRRPLFALSVLTSLAAFTTQGLAFVGLPFYFVGVLGYDAVDTGLLMTPWPIVVALAAPLAGRLSDRHPPGLLGGIGLAVLSAGMASLAWLPAHPSVVDIAVRMAVCGIGFGLFQSPNLRAPRNWCASACANAVLPIPPAPTTVTSQCESISERSEVRSSARPKSGGSSAGRLVRGTAVSSQGVGVEDGLGTAAPEAPWAAPSSAAVKR